MRKIVIVRSIVGETWFYFNARRTSYTLTSYVTIICIISYVSKTCIVLCFCTTKIQIVTPQHVV